MSFCLVLTQQTWPFESPFWQAKVRQSHSPDSVRLHWYYLTPTFDE